MGLVDLMRELGLWNWWILGLVLLVAELAAPGAFMLWLGVAALTVGVLSLVFVWPWQAQMVAFGLFSLVNVALARRWTGREPPTDRPDLNEPIRRLVGLTLTLKEPIVLGVGRVQIDDTIWRVSGPDLPAGAKVRVVGSDGLVLQVAAAA